MLRDEITRHHYYLQLKSNAVNRDLPRDISEQALLLLGGLALQADFGDCVNSNSNNSENDGNGESKSLVDYFRVEEYLPPSLRTTWGISALHSCHRENRGMSRADAETHYIREACGLHEAINAHIYKMKSNKNENGAGLTMLIIYAKGLKIITEIMSSSSTSSNTLAVAHTSSSPSPSSTSSAASQTSLLPSSHSSNPTTTVAPSSSVTFMWPAISKLSFDRKKFELRSGENKITLYSNIDDKNKMLLALCRETHQFSMKIAPRLTEAIKREEEESNCIHACYLYSRALNLQYNSKTKNDQRISVISSTSSNTTSGIISDRVHSEDELEILINTPPIAAPSTESLALAHLLDCPSVSRQTSSVGQLPLKNPLNGSITALSIHSKNSEILETLKEKSVNELELSAASPTSQRNLGSQCSSTCSTLVIDTLSLSRTPILGTPLNASERRQTSTCSSLELEFSHTAQNSIVSSELTTTSSTNENRFTSVDGLQNDDVETASGVYTINHPAPTETSGVYTMNSSELTGQSSEIAESESHESSHYGSFHPNSEMGDKINGNNIDSVDGEFRLATSTQDGRHEFRMRSDSNISAAGSFRGDGSDPTEGKHNPLSAEELTELIVGRGTYPSHKTVSDTMDSDCDYVTLPMPLDGESYLQGSEDTAPTEDEYENELLKVPAPSPPQRIDSRSMTDIVEVTQPPPPPYNAHHETTGLRGPDIPPEIPALPALREKPPKIYPRKSVRSFSISSAMSTSTTIPEETPARFITTRPHINILKAHSMIGESAKPSYAAPTVNTINNLSQSPLPSASALGIPIVPYHNFHPAHKSFSHPFYHEKPVAPRTCVLLPVIKPRGHQSYVPPPMSTRPSPPPPPVYASQLARSQIELYQQQLYSDVDYVIYPLQDPAVSQQEYLDSKQGSILAAMAAQGNHPPTTYFACPTLRSHNRSWDACKNHALYRSTPFLSMALSSASRYASTQNLSDTYIQLPGTYSPLYSPSVASLCSSYEPPPPLRPQRHHHVSNTKVTNSLTANGIFSLSRSDDNILNSIDTMPKSRRPIPPPPSNKRHLRKPPMPMPKDDSDVATAPPTPPSGEKL